MPKIKSSKLEIKEKRYNNFDIFCANFSLFWLGNKLFLAVQDSSIGDLVTHSLSESVSESGFDFSDFREHCRAVVDTCGFSDGDGDRNGDGDGDNSYHDIEG